MKKFVFWIIIPVFLFSILILGTAELYLRSLPNDFKYKREFMDDNANKVEIITLGASDPSMDIMPRCFDLQPSFCCAYATQSPNYDYWILSKYIEQMDSLKYVIYSWNLQMLYRSIKPNGVAPTYVKKYAIYYDCPYYKGFENQFEISANITDIYSKIKGDNHKLAFTTTDFDGYQSGYYDDIPYEEEMWNGYIDSKIKEYNALLEVEGVEEQKKENLDYMYKIFDLCKTHNVTVLMVRFPIDSRLSEGIDKAAQEEVDYHLSQFLQKYDNIKLLDYRDCNLFSYDEMYNANHLNPRGAKRFTRILGKIG